jgi:RNA-binding protein YlmH
MASTSPFQQYLSPTDVTMLDRMLKKVCVRNSIAGGSADAERVAALLIREFQYGANAEANLMTAFNGDGDFKLGVPVGRLSR